MKKSNLSVLLAVGALAFTTLAPKLAAADSPVPTCCSATNDSPAADPKAKPDLLKTCPVSGEKLGEMGKPYTFTYKDQEVKLCCKGCKKDFDKTPDKFIAKIRAADKKK